jgi:serine protease Do
MKLAILQCLFALAILAAPVRAQDPFLRRTTTVRVVEQVGPAVVNITTERLVKRRNPFGYPGNDPFFDRFFQAFFEPRLPRKANSLGSGVVIDAAGHILTNEHVVGRADRIRVSIADGSSGDLMVGEPVIAIGNPFGLSNTVTTGVISATDRSIRTENLTYHGFLQTDASINPGNSGGPLLNAEGKLIAINTAVYNGGQGIGFAIPIDVAQRVVSELIAHGEILPVWLGLEFQDLSRELRGAMELPDDLVGALVNRVREKSPGARGGLRRGDVVTHVDGHAVSSARGFFEILVTVTPRQIVAVSYWRNGDTGTSNVLAEEFPADLVEQITGEILGMDLHQRDEGGFIVMGVREGSGAQRIGIRVGDLLLAINGRNLADDEALRRAVLELRGHPRALVMVQRGAGRYNVAIPLI